MQDTLGDRLKAVEQVEAGRRAVKGKPIMARLDGRAFHTFTHGLGRPYDKRMSQLMIDTTKFLVEQTHALVGYTQSDEITLCWYEAEDSNSQYLFDGKFQKLTSVLASTATAYFAKYVGHYLPEKAEAFPTFDCRVWQPANLFEAYSNYMWRQDDAVKNSISMAAQAVYSARKLQGIGSGEKKRWLAEIGEPWDAHPQFFKSGTFVQRKTKEIILTPEQLEKIPERHRAANSGPVVRSFVEDVNIGLLRDEPNAVVLLFGQQDAV